MLAHRIRYHCNYAMGKYKYKYTVLGNRKIPGSGRRQGDLCCPSRNPRKENKNSAEKSAAEIKRELHPKMKVSYLVVFGALSRMVKVRGACDKPFWVYKRLNKLRHPAPEN